jgi:hypothetical protein
MAAAPVARPLVNTTPQLNQTSAGGATGNLNPAYQTAIPQQTAAQAGAIPQVSAQSIVANAGPLGYTPAQSGVDTSAASFLAAMQAAANPQWAQAQQALNEQLANAGVVGGGAIGAQQQLSLQEQAALAGQEQSGLLTLKGDELQQALANMGAQNTASQFGITNRLGATTQDVANNLAAQQQNQTAALNLGEYNATNQMNTDQFNLENIIKAGQSNDATYNAFLQQQQAQQNQDWLAQLQSQTDLNMQGAHDQTAAYQQAFTNPNPTPINFASLGAQYAPTSTASPNINANVQTAPINFPTYTPMQLSNQSVK